MDTTLPINQIIHGNCLDVMRKMPDNSIDAVVTDPPYGWNFMNLSFDKDVPTTDIWKEVYRVLKPGGHMLVACGTRTYHRMVTRIEDAGFYVKDMILWCHAMGFPKSLDISKALDKELKCEVVGIKTYAGPSGNNRNFGVRNNDSNPTKRILTAPSSDLAKQFDGWGTQLKPAIECFALLQKTISEKTIAKNVMKWGTGGINIGACRITVDENDRLNKGGSYSGNRTGSNVSSAFNSGNNVIEYTSPPSRFPSNLLLDGSQEVLDLFPVSKQNGYRKNPSTNATTWFGKTDGSHIEGERGYNDTGSASRFFYCAKASKSEKNAGLGNLPAQNNMRVNAPRQNEAAKHATKMANHHPTVKPLKLMEYLCRLIVPPNGIVLDPFLGSGTTTLAAINEGFNYIGIEMNEEYVEIARNRLTTKETHNGNI